MLAPVGFGLEHFAIATQRIERVGEFGAAQRSDDAPDLVVVDRRAGPGVPDERDGGESRVGIAIQQVLAVRTGERLGEMIGKPVVVSDEFEDVRRAVVEDARLFAEAQVAGRQSLASSLADLGRAAMPK